ncbi:MAG TPA: VOC family protein, partial [Solirubrobacteraceae bacterium]|nr:VOC family protein [Solirubrobacteraceae bacterium]
RADVAHIGHAELLSPDLEASLRFLTGVLGMSEVAREGDCVHLRGYGDYQRCTLKLSAAEQAGIGHLGLRARSPQALERLVAGAERRGCGEGWVEGDVGHGPAYRARTPGGHLLELYYETERYDGGPGERSPARNQHGRRGGPGVGVKRLDHVNLLSPDVAADRAFAESALGYRTLDISLDPDGRESGAWTTASIAPLELVFVADRAGRSGRLHHLAFWVDTREEVLRAADIFVDHGVRIELAPARHTIGQGFFLYAFEPGGNRIEVTTAVDFVYDPDPPVRVWTAEERAAGIGWGTPFPESWRSYGTPA